MNGYVTAVALIKILAAAKIMGGALISLRGANACSTKINLPPSIMKELDAKSTMG